VADEQQLLDLLQYLLDKYNTSFVGSVSSAGTGKTLYVNVGNGTVIPAISLNVTAPGEVGVVADSTGKFYCFKTNTSNLSRSRTITARRFNYEKKETIVKLDAAILYALRETKTSPVNFVNPTWIMTGNLTTGYVCTPRPEGDKGQYPTLGVCLASAEIYRQIASDIIDSTYANALLDWERAVAAREDALNNIPVWHATYLAVTSDSPGNFDYYIFNPIAVTAATYGRGPARTVVAEESTRYKNYIFIPGSPTPTVESASILILYTRIFIENSGPDLGPPPPPVRAANPPANTFTNASNKALSFYLKKDLNTDPIKLVELNEEEAFEAILVKTDTAVSAFIKTGRSKLHEFLADAGGSDVSGGGTGDSGGGGISEPGTWTVADRNSWYKITNYNETANSIEYVYSTGPTWSQLLTNNYQAWRYSHYDIYPLFVGDVCLLGTEYLSFSTAKDKYKSIAKYQNLSNSYTPKKQVDIELLNDLVNQDSFNTSGGVYSASINSSDISFKLIANNTVADAGVCNRRLILQDRSILTTSSNPAFVIIKGFIK
jgi:hypothetical protein